MKIVRLIDWLIEWIEFYAVSVIFQPFNGGKIIRMLLTCFLFEKVRKNYVMNLTCSKFLLFSFLVYRYVIFNFNFFFKNPVIRMTVFKSCYPNVTCTCINGFVCICLCIYKQMQPSSDKLWRRCLWLFVCCSTSSTRIFCS